MGKKPKPLGPIVTQREFLMSKAWHDLSGKATQVFFLFRMKCKMEDLNKKKGKEKWVATNGRELVFPHREAKNKYGYSLREFARAVDNLIKNGFIDIVEHGVGTARKCTIYGISERWRKYGTTEFVEHKRDKACCGYKVKKDRDKDDEADEDGDEGD